MIGIAAAALLAAAPQGGPAQPSTVAQAQATVRIVSGVRLTLQQSGNGNEVPKARSATIRTSEGPQPAKLIEFE